MLYILACFVIFFSGQASRATRVRRQFGLSVEERTRTNVTDPDSCPRIVIPTKYVPTKFVQQRASCINDLPFRSLSLTPKSGRYDKTALTIYLYDSGYKKVPSTKERIKLCQTLFPRNNPVAWPIKSESKPLCMLAKTRKGVQPIFWSDYNVKRGIPNFVAYVNKGWSKEPGSLPKRKWRTLTGFPDKTYATSDVKTSSSSHCAKEDQEDCACYEKVSSRGHLATLSHLSWDKVAATATNTYVNTMPARQPFDGAQWNAREMRNSDYARKNGEVFVIKGPSLESDGKTDTGVDVPSMFWAAIYDPRKNQARAWTFRNGYQQPKKLKSDSGFEPIGCFGADALKVNDIEKAIGVRLWPAVAKKVDLLREW